MAGYPPPYPPFGPDARQQERFARQQMKAQARAALQAAKAQRNAYRQQARALRRGSIVGPLLIVGIGVVLLLIEFGKVPAYRFTDWYSRWWPLLLVTAGIILILEWAFDHRSTQAGVPFGRRGVGGGVIFLLILLAAAGACASNFRDGWGFLNNLHIGPDNVDEFFGERHDFDQQIDQPFPAGTTLNIDNPHGDVTVTGKSGDDKIHIVVNKQVYTLGEQDGSSRADQLSPRVALVGGTLTVSVPNLDSSHADLSITVPDFAQATISANHGDITVSDLRAPLNVTANRGDITLDRIAGTVTAHVNSAHDSFTAHDITGDVTLRGHADELSLAGVTGAVSLEGEFFGDTHLEHLGGPLSFRTDRTQFSAGKLDGMVDISTGSEMTGSELVGPIELHTRSRNIAFERIAGPVNIVNSHGTVDLTSSAPLANISVENSSGAVTLTVPLPTRSQPGISIQAQANDGAIEDELDDSHVDDAPHASHSDTIGNGAAHLTLRTSHADITIHKGPVDRPAPPPEPTHPASPTPPMAPPRPGHTSVSF
jgi:DUF4097 and DUF4098 domain-containing protein YvlB